MQPSIGQGGWSVKVGGEGVEWCHAANAGRAGRGMGAGCTGTSSPVHPFLAANLPLHALLTAGTCVVLHVVARRACLGILVSAG